ncbi:unnamed protein product, partial [Heterosigma akashiwo]
KKRKKKAVFNWSGGKDSSMALKRILDEGVYEVPVLLTSLSAEHKRVSMHGVREEVLDAQAEALGIPLYKFFIEHSTTMEEYDQKMRAAIEHLKGKFEVRYSIFGDIFLEQLKAYREEKCNEANLIPVFPLWKEDTAELAKSFSTEGFKAYVSAVDGSKLGKEFCGRSYDLRFLHDLPADVDPCGENGEFHTMVYDGPIFKAPLSLLRGEVVDKSYKPAKKEDDNHVCSTSKDGVDKTFYFCDLLLPDS